MDYPPIKPPQHTTTATAPVRNAAAAAAPDLLRNGPIGAQAGVSPMHPVEAIQANYRQHEEDLKMSVVSNTQGHFMAQAIQMERAALSQHHRLPVLHNSMMGLEISMGLDSTITFDDYLNDPRDAENMGHVTDMAEASPSFR